MFEQFYFKIYRREVNINSTFILDLSYSARGKTIEAENLIFSVGVL